MYHDRTCDARRVLVDISKMVFVVHLWERPYPKGVLAFLYCVQMMQGDDYFKLRLAKRLFCHHSFTNLLLIS